MHDVTYNGAGMLLFDNGCDIQAVYPPCYSIKPESNATGNLIHLKFMNGEALVLDYSQFDTVTYPTFQDLINHVTTNVVCP